MDVLINQSSNGAVLITGGAKRLGREIARHLAKNGYEIIIQANNSVIDAESLCREINDLGGTADFIIGNLEDQNFVQSLIVDAAKLAKSQLFGLVNNASIFESDEAQTFTKEMWDRHFTINAMVPCQLAQNFASHIGEQKGAIINLLDQRVFRPNPLFFTYSLSKSALLCATKTMAQSFAPNIRVNAIAPGPSLQNGRQSEADFAAQTDATILKSGSPPIAIAEAAAYLLGANHTTGQTIAVDGGQSLIWLAPDIEGVNE